MTSEVRFIENSLIRHRLENLLYCLEEIKNAKDIPPKIPIKFVREMLHHYLGEDSTRQSVVVPRQLGDYEITARLGRGGFGNVYVAKHLDKEVALKIAVKPRPQSRRRTSSLFSEYRMLQKVAGHDNIVQVRECGSVGDLDWFSMDLCPGGNLHERFIREEARFTLEEARQKFFQMASAFQHVHRNCIAHFDVKPGNFVFKEDGSLALIDFGIAVDVACKEPRVYGRGSAQYMAPEICKQDTKIMGPESDVFSLGIILYQMAVWRLPISLKPRDSHQRVLRKHSKINYRSIPEDLKGLLERMLELDPAKRATMDEVCAHKWLNTRQPDVVLIHRDNVQVESQSLLVNTGDFEKDMESSLALNYYAERRSYLDAQRVAPELPFHVHQQRFPEQRIKYSRHKAFLPRYRPPLSAVPIPPSQDSDQVE